MGGRSERWVGEVSGGWEEVCPVKVWCASWKKWVFSMHSFFAFLMQPFLNLLHNCCYLCCVCVSACTPSLRYSTVDVSIAVSTEGGLITPIVFDADEKVGGVDGRWERWEECPVRVWYASEEWSFSLCLYSQFTILLVHAAGQPL